MALTEATLEDQRICLVCRKQVAPYRGFSETSGGLTEEPEIPLHKYFFYGSNNHSGLNQQLWNVFIARKLLHLTQDQCEQFLQYVETKQQNQSNPHPSEWFAFCGECSVILEDAWIVYKAILRLNKELDTVSTQLRNKIVENCKIANNTTEENTTKQRGIENKIWNILLISRGEYVVKEEIDDSSADKEDSTEPLKLNEDPFFSTPPDPTTFPENNVAAPTTASEDTNIPDPEFKNGLEDTVNQSTGPTLEIHFETSYIDETSIKNHSKEEPKLNGKGNEKNDPDNKTETESRLGKKGRRKKIVVVDNNFCEICSKEYSTTYALRLHQEIAHSDGKYTVPCEGCGKNFIHSHYLKIHYRSCKKCHADMKPRKPTTKKSKKQKSSVEPKDLKPKRRQKKKPSSTSEETEKPKIQKKRGRKPKNVTTQECGDVAVAGEDLQPLIVDSYNDTISPIPNIQSHFLQTIQQMGFTRATTSVDVGNTAGTYSHMNPGQMET